MPIVIRGKLPDMHKKLDAIKFELRLALWNAGNDVIQDNVQKIDRRVAFDDAAQKANSAPYARWKRRARGHDVPLRKDRVLDNPSLYRVKDVAPRGNDYAQVVVKLPPDRRDIVGYLREKGYRYWGVSPAIRKGMRVRLKTAIRKALKS